MEHLYTLYMLSPLTLMCPCDLVKQLRLRYFVDLRTYSPAPKPPNLSPREVKGRERIHSPNLSLREVQGRECTDPPNLSFRCPRCSVTFSMYRRVFFSFWLSTRNFCRLGDVYLQKTDKKHYKSP